MLLENGGFHLESNLGWGCVFCKFIVYYKSCYFPTMERGEVIG